MKTVRATLLVGRVVKVVYDVYLEDDEEITKELIEQYYYEQNGETYDEVVKEESVYTVIMVHDAEGQLLGVPDSDEEIEDVT